MLSPCQAGALITIQTCFNLHVCFHCQGPVKNSHMGSCRMMLWSGGQLCLDTLPEGVMSGAWQWPSGCAWLGCIPGSLQSMLLECRMELEVGGHVQYSSCYKCKKCTTAPLQFRCFGWSDLLFFPPPQFPFLGLDFQRGEETTTRQEAAGYTALQQPDMHKLSRRALHAKLEEQRQRSLFIANMISFSLIWTGLILKQTRRHYHEALTVCHWWYSLLLSVFTL